VTGVPPVFFASKSNWSKQKAANLPAIPGERRDSMICKVRECYRGAMFFGLSGHFVM